MKVGYSFNSLKILPLLYHVIFKAGVRLLQLRLMQPNSPAYSHNSQLASLVILAIQHSSPLVLSRPYGTLEPFLSANYTLGFLFRIYCVSIYIFSR